MSKLDLEKKLRSKLKLSSNESQNMFNNIKKLYSSFEKEQELYNRLLIARDNINRSIDYTLSESNKLINKKKEFLDSIDLQINSEKEILLIKEKLVNIESENIMLVDKVEDCRQKKLDYFNKINKLRRENNSGNDSRIKKYHLKNEEIKKLYKEYSIMINFMKTRIIYIDENPLNKDREILCYFIEKNNDSFQAYKFKIIKGKSTYEKNNKDEKNMISESNNKNNLSNASYLEIFNRGKLFWEALNSNLIKNCTK